MSSVFSCVPVFPVFYCVIPVFPVFPVFYCVIPVFPVFCCVPSVFMCSLCFTVFSVFSLMFTVFSCVPSCFPCFSAPLPFLRKPVGDMFLNMRTIAYCKYRSLRICLAFVYKNPMMIVSRARLQRLARETTMMMHPLRFMGVGIKIYGRP